MGESGDSIFAIEGGSAPEWLSLQSEAASDIVEKATATVAGDPDFQAIRTEIETSADSDPLQSELTAAIYKGRRRTIAAVHYRGWTGEGFDECGGPDLDRRALSLIDMGRAPTLLISPVEIEADILGVWIRSGELEYALHQWPDQIEIFSGSGEPQCGLSIDFCDCPC